ncbi:putative secreted protein [Propionispora sp. 2/2-37]|uniref:glycosyl hydrolase family 18 protein n=1 Tax=Propionispora sp. 2/2-37 TaxID=1677858 RepID=UPI0006BB980E|nr:glycosyl hydrolase family 18 protein [Propionispora sp. 2/2-37]CUH95751.1 putative secreted protein [Propionispora sp. 2/2-37]
MRWCKISVVFVIMVSVLILMLSGGCGGQKSPAPKLLPSVPNLNIPARLIIGYYENPWPGTPDKTGSFPSMKTHANSMTGVGPFWYRATQDGTLEARDSQLVYDTARNSGLKIIPLITNKSGATEAVLGDAAIRSKVIDNIVKLAQEKQYDGINIDFELLPPAQRENLTAFVAELYPKLKALNKLLIISVFPQVDVAEDVSGAYDYPELAKNADYLQIMTYDHHWSTSPPGPIAPIEWYEKNIKYAIEQCGGPNKVLIGLGAYGYDWAPDKDGETVTYADAIVRAEQNGAKIMFDEASKSPYFKYDNHEVWFENADSTSAKLDIIAKYNPAGIAIWRLGQEQPDIWPLIDQKFPKQQ